MKKHVKDLSFYLLALDLKNVRLFKASRNEIEEVTSTKIPKNLKEVSGIDQLEKQLRTHSSSGIGDSSGKKMFHGHGVGTNHHKDIICHFFREIDKELNKTLKEKEIPLVSAGIDYLLPIYQKVNKYPVLIKKHIVGNTQRISPKELHKKSLPIVASYYLNSER